jgi:hypothetical protein
LYKIKYLGIIYKWVYLTHQVEPETIQELLIKIKEEETKRPVSLDKSAVDGGPVFSYKVLTQSPDTAAPRVIYPNYVTLEKLINHVLSALIQRIIITGKF